MHTLNNTTPAVRIANASTIAATASFRKATKYAMMATRPMATGALRNANLSRNIQSHVAIILLKATSNAINRI